ncbi:MAG TPA: adhesin [Micromonosporaceae bacterium]|jgi:Fe-S cluster assembly iron-binding protein IscA
MITLTDNAVAVIHNLTEQPEVPDGAGLRIATDTSAGQLTLTVAPEPMTGDQVLDSGGARLFLDEAAAELLDDKSLDATIDDGGRVQFMLAEQPS